MNAKPATDPAEPDGYDVPVVPRTPGEVVAQVLAEHGNVAVDGFVCGTSVGIRPKLPPVQVDRYRCPWCDPATGRWEDGELCRHCHGTTLTNDVGGWDEADLTPVPTPPAVMRRPCTDCAYRPGSPETDYAAPGTPGGPPGPESVFFCHHGLVRVGDGYSSPIMLAGLPIGAFVCAGWWAMATDRPLPAEAFHDPGGADRRTDTPEAAR